MKRVMWSVDPVTGNRFRASTNTGFQPLFQEEVDADPLRAAILERFANRVFTFDEAVAFTWLETPYLDKHLRKLVLKPLEQEGLLESVDPKPKRRRFTYPPGTKLRIVP